MHAPLRLLLLSSLLTIVAKPAHAQSEEERPFRVYEADPATLVVERVRASGAAIEGFVLDRDALLETLRARVLEEQGLGKLAHVSAERPVVSRRTRYGSDSADAEAAKYLGFAGVYGFSHRFAAPFDRIEAKLELSPLGDDGDEASWLYPLTGMLALSIVLGLFALYRMVAVRVRFAERRNNFVAAVSHELKTPLTAIRMYGEMLRDDLVESEDKRHEYYATISAETERLTRLINNVLELSRLERDARPMQLVVGDVAMLAQDVVNTLRPHAEREGFTLEAHADPGLPAARFDRDALTQVLFNLLDNALKYGRAGKERRIEVRCRRAGEGVQVSVIDRGPGVQTAQLDTIFEPFFRAQDELTRTQPGTGIGLSLVRGLVERMQGRVEGRNLSPGFEVRITLLSA